MQTQKYHSLLSDYMFDLESPHSKINNFYRNNYKAPRFGFIDETYWSPKYTKDGVHQGFYSVTAIILESDKLKEIRDALIDDFGHHYHATDEDQEENIKMLRKIKPYLDLDSSIITVNTFIPFSENKNLSENKKEQARFIRQARNECILTLLKLSQDAENPISHFVIERLKANSENRALDDNRLDRELISHLKDQGIIGNIKLTQRSPKAEHLLWIPDAVAYAVGRALRYSDYSLYNEISDAINIYDTHTQGYIRLDAKLSPTNKLIQGISSAPTEKLKTEDLINIALGKYIREEIAHQYGTSKRTLPPEGSKDGTGLRRAKSQGVQLPIEKQHALDLTIARNNLSSQQQEAITELGNRPSEIDVETQRSLSFLQPMMQKSGMAHTGRSQNEAPRRGPEPPERGVEL